MTTYGSTSTVIVHEVKVERSSDSKSCHIPVRFLHVALISWGIFNLYGLRVNLNVAIVAMVNTTERSSGMHFSYCKGWTNTTTPESSAEFNWNNDEQGQILSAFNFGYLFSLLPAGVLSVHIGGKWPIFSSIFLSSIINILTPFAAYQGFIPLIVSRVLLGIAQGTFFPSVNTMLGTWIPPDERSVSQALTSVTGLGTMVYMTLAGLLASSDILQGWPSIFYFSGIAGLCWCLVWVGLAHSFPSKHPWISRKEREYIMTSLQQTDQVKLIVPWRAILTSLPVWAIVICQICSDFGFYVFLSDTPIYLNNIQGMDISTIGILSGVPYLAEFIIAVLGGILADRLISRRIARVVVVRKGFTMLGLLSQTVALLIAAYPGCNPWIVVACLIVSSAMGGALEPGYCVNPLDVAPCFAGVIDGIANTFSTVGGIVAPLMVAGVTTDKATVDQWRFVFWITCGVFWFGTLFYIIFASGKRQEWDKQQNVMVVNSNETDPLIRPINSENQ